MRSIAILFSIFLLCLTVNCLASTPPKKELWNRWAVNNPTSKKSITHKQWDTFLKKHITKNRYGITTVDYRHLPKSSKKLLDDYLKKMSAINIGNYNRKEQYAYWVNVYNALVTKTIIQHYPVSSINDINISPGYFTEGPWGAYLIKVNGVPVSLNDIEHRILRPIWNDVRTLYVLNHAAIGSPNLFTTALTGDNIEEILNLAAKQFINSLRGAQVINGKLITSKIYEWYKEDFGGDQQDVLQHLKNYAKTPLRKKLKNINEINKTVFNWHLNDRYLHKKES